MTIRGPQLKRVVDAFLAAFPRQKQLEQLLEYRLTKRLGEYVGENSNNRDRVFDLFAAAGSEGWDLELIAAARASNPGNRELLAVAQELALAPTLPAQFEAWVDARNQIHDAGRWYQRLGQALTRVGRVDVDGAPAGTAFLVGPDLVLTNHHVVDRAYQRLAVRFDYRSGGPADGTLVPVAEVVDRSPPSAHDLEAVPATEPTVDQLDYALLRLQQEVGREPVGAEAEPDAPARGWFAPPVAPPSFAAGTALFIVQHPKGDRVSLALDTTGVLGVNRGGTRVRYRTNTEAGSSGSPCFDQDWNLIAIHHVGDPSWQAAAFNQGIPIAAITERLRRVKALTLPASES